MIVGVFLSMVSSDCVSRPQLGSVSCLKKSSCSRSDYCCDVFWLIPDVSVLFMGSWHKHSCRVLLYVRSRLTWLQPAKPHVPHITCSGIGTWNWLILFSCVSTAWLSTLMDPCRLSDICNSCHELARCRPMNGSNNACFCKDGYTGDGTTFCHGDYRHTIHMYRSVFPMIWEHNQPRM